MAPPASSKQRNRSKTGCTSCLLRKIKCDEQHPECLNCSKAKVKCLWDMSSRAMAQRVRRKHYARPGAHDSEPAATRSCGLTRGRRRAAETSSETLLTNILELNHVSSVDDYSTSTASYDSPIPRSIHIPYVCCANSLALSPRERRYLEYFPFTDYVKILGKPFDWSNFNYIHRVKATEEAAVMCGILALSAGELSQTEISTGRTKPGLVYYNLALQLIEAELHTPTDSGKMESVTSAFFLILAYDWRFGSSVSNLQRNIQLFLSYLDRSVSHHERRNQKREASDDLLTPFCAQVLIWMLYIESSCIRGLVSFKLMEYFCDLSGESLHLNKIVTLARYSLLTLYKDLYPPAQQEDDLENYCPLLLIHQDYVFRYRIWHLYQRLEQGELIDSEVQALWSDLLMVKQEYRDLFELRNTATTSVACRRVFITLCEGIAGFYCNFLLYIRLFRDITDQTGHRHHAVSELFELCHILHIRYPSEPALGLPWYLLIAGLETNDKFYREWARDRLKQHCGSWNTCKWANDMFNAADGLAGNDPVGEAPTCILQLIRPCPAFRSRDQID